MTSILVRTQVEFFHCYPEAPVQVSYLRDLHRHMLHVQLKLEVFHEDRELEFIMVKHELYKFLVSYLNECPSRTSCEEVAQAILNWAACTYGMRKGSVQVWEDNENGVEVENYV